MTYSHFISRKSSCDMVELEFYVDDGDGTFDPDADLYVEIYEENDEGGWIVDGGEDDETPAGDGVWQITFDIVMIYEGNFLGVQGATLFMVAAVISGIPLVPELISCNSPKRSPGG